jgi:quercetin 2,3-dioxygenase
VELLVARSGGKDLCCGEHHEVGDRHLVSFDKGDVVTVRAKSEPVRFLLVSGRPIGEPIAWRGPIVMNSDEELRVAFEELDNDTFIKHRNPPK